jgi:hypothetical protein
VTVESKYTSTGMELFVGILLMPVAWIISAGLMISDWNSRRNHDRGPNVPRAVGLR